MKPTSDKITIFFFSVLAIALISALTIFYNNTKKVKSSTSLVVHTQEVLRKSNNVLLDILSIESGSRGYVITGSIAFLEPFDNSILTISQSIKGLDTLTYDNQKQQTRIHALTSVIADKISFTKTTIELIKQKGLSDAEKMIRDGEGNILMGKIRSLIAEINSEEFKLLKLRKIESVNSNRNSIIILISIFALIIIIFFLVIVLIKKQHTRNKLAENEKLVSKYARSLIEASLDPLVTINAEGKITDVNEASVKVTGVSRDNLIGTNFSNYFTEPEKALLGYRKVFEKGFVSNYPLTIKHIAGELTDVLYNASVYRDSNGKVLGVFAAARDITAQKQSSQYARSLIEASLDPLVTISAEGKITDVNIASAKITGVSREKLIGTDFSNYFTDSEKAQAGYHEAFEKGFVSDYPLTIKDKNGILIDVLYNASVYKDDNGDIKGVFAAARDVTAQNNALEAIRERTAQYESVNNELEAFTYSVSHDLRAPLRAINGYAKILQEDYTSTLDDDGINTLNAIMKNSKRMGELIDDLLAFSRLGRKIVPVSEINMSVLVKSVTEEAIIGNTSDLEFVIKELLPAKGQQALIKQVWVNLISNAIKYSKHKSKIIIEIGSYNKDKLIVYYVKDNGAGFDMQYYDKLFGVFQRLHSQEEFEGTGIGLAIVQKIAQRHNGNAWAESKIDEGACFYFSLPIINF